MTAQTGRNRSPRVRQAEEQIERSPGSPAAPTIITAGVRNGRCGPDRSGAAPSPRSPPSAKANSVPELEMSASAPTGKNAAANATKMPVMIVTTCGVLVLRDGLARAPRAAGRRGSSRRRCGSGRTSSSGRPRAARGPRRGRGGCRSAASRSRADVQASASFEQTTASAARHRALARELRGLPGRDARPAHDRLRADGADHARRRPAVEHGADRKAADQPDRHVALRVLGFLGRGRDRVEADIGEEDRRRRADAPMPAEPPKAGGQERIEIVGLIDRQASG